MFGEFGNYLEDSYKYGKVIQVLESKINEER